MCSTNFGEQLSAESLELIKAVRHELTEQIPTNFDTNYNIFRFVLAQERLHYRNKGIIVRESAKALNRHLKIRKCLDLDGLPESLTLDKIPLFKDRIMPKGEILSHTDSSNRLLWFIEYETIAHSMKSSDAIRYQFWQFEYMLRRVNIQVDMRGFEINPFTMLFVSSGTLSYYSQLFHYDNYPELISPIEIVNVAKWIYLPYRLIKAMMPVGFCDRFRLHDEEFLQRLSAEISLEHIPTVLGGHNKTIRCVPAIKLDPTLYWKQTGHEDLMSRLEHVHVGPRKMKFLRLQVEVNCDAKDLPTISWYFRTDGDLYFGVFYKNLPQQSVMNGDDTNNDENMEINRQQLDGLELVYPMFKLTAKLHHEWDAVECTKSGVYFLVFCNKHSWLNGKTVNIAVQLRGSGASSQTVLKQCYFNDSQREDDDGLSIVTRFNILPKTKSFPE